MSGASGSPNARPNFFELLGLNPDTPWNQTEFERILIEKRREWTSLSSMAVGAKKQEAKQNLNLVGEIERVMKDAALRDKEAREARLRRDKDKQRLLDEFKDALRIAALKTYVYESEISFWATQYAAI